MGVVEDVEVPATNVGDGGNDNEEEEDYWESSHRDEPTNRFVLVGWEFYRFDDDDKHTFDSSISDQAW